MCIAIPSKIILKKDLLAIVDVYGARREVSLILLPEEVKEGDYVLIHAGFAIQKISTDLAKEVMEAQLEYAKLLFKEDLERDNSSRRISTSEF
ncbi:MAG: HypC/HybG/HupF family hydrogenase formation chaperone [Thermodesulfovibrionales bacterium]|nr:HypC/HybG/HupF family hydrogenase formation chaperone [Thermodesulfovibrionales bacterium]